METARNEGLRICAGLPRATKISEIRRITGTKTLRTLGETHAGRLVDQSLRVRNILLHRVIEKQVAQLKSMSTTLRSAGTTFLVKQGLLTISRLKLGRRVMDTRAANLFSIHYASVSRTETTPMLKNELPINSYTSYVRNTLVLQKYGLTAH